MNNLSIEELINIAINIEKNGQIFYKFAKNKSKNKELKSLFQMLLDEEHEHEKIFRAMLSEKTEINTITDYEDNLKNYIKLIASQEVFSEQSLKEKIIDNKNALVKFAINIEKESITYYTSLKPLFKNKETINKIIEIEIGHLLKLHNYFK